jgi:hypothetical protein
MKLACGRCERRSGKSRSEKSAIAHADAAGRRLIGATRKLMAHSERQSTVQDKMAFAHLIAAAIPYYGYVAGGEHGTIAKGRRFRLW